MKKNTFNRICAAILAIVTVFLLIPAGMLPTIAEEPKIWNGTAAAGFAGGTGSEAKPYLISTAEQLVFFAEQVNNGYSFAGKFVKLTNDILLNDTTNWEQWETSAPKNHWTAIGKFYDSKDYGFAGTFDGDEHIVSGIYINTTSDFQGLFGFAHGATIQNLGVEKSFIKGSNFVGGVVGQNYYGSTVNNCYNTGEVSGTGNGVGGVVGLDEGTVSNCRNTGNVSGTKYVGGVVGFNCYGTVSDCYNTGTVSGGRDVGGVVGVSIGDPDTATVINCYNTGEVSGVDHVGGVVGYNYRTVTNCYNTGTVSGTAYVGGVVGRNDDDDGAVSNCYNTGTVSGDGYIGGVVGGGYGTVRNCYYLSGCAKDGNGTVQYGINGADASGQTTGLTNTQMKQKKSFVGFDFETVWTMDGNPEYSNPELKDVPMVVPTGVKGDINGDDTIDAFDYQMQGGKKMKKIILVAIALVVVAACITVVTVAFRRKR